jgi:hypothetical protein
MNAAPHLEEGNPDFERDQCNDQHFETQRALGVYHVGERLCGVRHDFKLPRQTIDPL